MANVLLQLDIIEPTADESLGIEDGVAWIPGSLVFGTITNDSLRVGEGHIRWSCLVALVVGNDFDLKSIR